MPIPVFVATTSASEGAWHVADPKWPVGGIRSMAETGGTGHFQICAAGWQHPFLAASTELMLGLGVPAFTVTPSAGIFFQVNSAAGQYLARCCSSRSLSYQVKPIRGING